MSETIKTDNLLTNFATRYRAGQYAADFIAPPFKVNLSSDKYAVYGKDEFRVYNNKIAGREEAKEITADVTSASYSCDEYALSGFISTRRMKNADKPIDLFFDRTRQLKNAQRLAREKRIYDVVVAATGTSANSETVSVKWDTSSGVPIARIRYGMGIIADALLGIAPNRIAIPLAVALKMISCDEYKDMFKYTQADKLFDLVSGLRNLGIEPLITGAYATNTTKGGASDPAAESLWGDDVILFHAEPSPTLESRAFMYSPFVAYDEMRRWEEPKQRGWKIEIYEDIDELLVDSGAVYRFKDCLT